MGAGWCVRGAGTGRGGGGGGGGLAKTFTECRVSIPNVQ